MKQKEPDLLFFIKIEYFQILLGYNRFRKEIVEDIQRLNL